GRRAPVFAADDDSSGLAHPAEVRMQPCDKADCARPRFRKLEQHHAKPARRIACGRRHEFMPRVAVCDAGQRVARRRLTLAEWFPDVVARVERCLGLCDHTTQAVIELDLGFFHGRPPWRAMPRMGSRVSPNTTALDYRPAAPVA